MADLGGLSEKENCACQEKKIIAPIIITVVLVCYYILYFAMLLTLLPGFIIKLMCGIIPLVFAGVTVFVCIQRINEIRSGEEDDLSKY